MFMRRKGGCVLPRATMARQLLRLAARTARRFVPLRWVPKHIYRAACFNPMVLAYDYRWRKVAHWHTASLSPWSTRSIPDNRSPTAHNYPPLSSTPNITRRIFVSHMIHQQTSSPLWCHKTPSSFPLPVAGPEAANTGHHRVSEHSNTMNADRTPPGKRICRTICT
jgi:hypothetical protein